MKLIIAGATGLVGTEVVRQSLKNPKITSIVTLSRRPLQVHDNGNGTDNISKLTSLVLEDFKVYSDEVKAQLADADACIW